MRRKIKVKPSLNGAGNNQEGIPLVKHIKYRFSLIFGICTLQIIVHISNIVSGHTLNQLGILPREPSSLLHILSSPWIHGSTQHLTGNLVGLSFFSTLCLVRSIPFYLLASLFIIVVEGLLVWLFGRSAYHIGASGWIYGLWSLAIGLAWFERNFVNIGIGLIALFFYSSMLFGMIPNNHGVSFEAHIFGAISGLLFAGMFAQQRK